MGDYRIVIEAAGGHGCQRERGNGQQVQGCGYMSCPDCMAREFVERLARKGNHVHKAELVHWPADMENRGYPKDGEVRDNLLTNVRSGDFPETKPK